MTIPRYIGQTVSYTPYERVQIHTTPPPQPGRRLGHFTISVDRINNDRQTCLAMLAGCIIVRAEFAYEVDAINYIALHEDFDVVPMGVIAPIYDSLVTEHPDGSVTREWRKTTEIWR